MTRVLPRFPAAVRGINALSATTQNGVLEIGIDPTNLAESADPTAPGNYTVILKSSTNELELAEVASTVVDIATKPEAVAGTDNQAILSALRGKQQAEEGAFRIGASFGQYKFGGNSPQSLPALQIGGGLNTEGAHGVVLGNDGYSSWVRFQPSRDESSIELVIYPSGGQGRASCVSGGNTITRLTGTTFKSAWVGRKIYFNEQYYYIASVPDANTLTVTAGSGAIPFAVTTTDTFHVIVTRGEGLCSISGNVITRTSGDPFIVFTGGAFKFWVNGTLRTVSSFVDTDTYVLTTSPGNGSNIPWAFETDVNDQITTFRLQKMLGSDEENLSIYARYDGYWFHSLFAGAGSYRKIVMGAGEMSAGNLARQLILQKNGDLSIVGDYDYEAIRVLNPTGISPVNRFETQGAPTGFGPTWCSRGADTNVPMNFDTKGTGAVTFTSNAFGGTNFCVYGTGGTSWLAVDGSTGGQPYLVAEGAAANINMSILGKGTGVVRIGNAGVNYFDVVGGPTTFSPGIRARGTDTNVGMGFDAQGTGAYTFTGGSFAATLFQIFGSATATSWLAIAGSTGAVPAVSANGAAADIDLGLFAKGTGTLRFGTFTSNADAAVNGYVTIKDAAGNVRKLATIA